jgi:hypothetical protein
MCHESWWRERRARRDEESEPMWRDFEATRPAEPPPIRDEPAEEIRLDTEEQEAVAAGQER